MWIMIAIINQQKKNKHGETLYFVLINNNKITEFYHKREYGLAACLRKAGDAVNNKNINKWLKFLLNEEINSEFKESKK